MSLQTKPSGWAACWQFDNRWHLLVVGLFSVVRTPLLALGVGTKMQAKDWGEENWVGLAQGLATSLREWRFAIVGSADERQRAELCCSL